VPHETSNSSTDNKYKQIADSWGVDVTDSSILLLQEFDRRFEELKHEASELKIQVNQWTGVTSELLKLVGDETVKTSVKKLADNTKALATVLSESEERLGTKIGRLNGKSDSFWYRASWLILGAAIVMCPVLFGVGWMNGANSGKDNVAEQFGGTKNLDFWKQVREQNKDQIGVCKSQGRAVCSIKLP